MARVCSKLSCGAAWQRVPVQNAQLRNSLVRRYYRCDAMASEQEKIAYLEEHVSYEVVMLNYTFMRLLASRPSTAEEQLDFNAYLESFGVHARNLLDFLSNKARGDERSASDYVPEFEAPDQARVKPALFRLEKQIMHVTALRTTDPQAKFDVDDT
jgi:hypothetical protein